MYLAFSFRDKLLINNSTIKYIVALSIIAISVIIASISVESLIKARKKSASVIDWSGKQRMHSQRIAFFSNSLLLANDSTKVEQKKQVIKKLKVDMLLIHNGLIHGNDSLNLPKIQSDEVYEMYFEEPLNLNEQVLNYLIEVDTFLYTQNPIARENAFATINISASNRLLVSLDQMVKQYVVEKNDIIKRMEITVLIALWIIILILILEYFFIFKPLMISIYQNKQKLMRQNNRLENLNQDLEQFIYAASHDLKTPIRGLHNLMQFLEADFSEDLKHRSKEYIDLIKNRVQRINVLIDGLMRFGAISQEKTTQTEYNLNKFIHRFIKNYNSEIVDIKIVSKLPTLVINPIWINEIFLNLIENAIRYNDKSICKIIIGHVESEHYYQFYIEDNGQGVHQKYHDKMFKLFQTLNNEEENPTAGIGLAIIKKIVSELDGKVWVKSAVNEHFTVFFSIPKEREV